MEGLLNFAGASELKLLVEFVKEKLQILLKTSCYQSINHLELIGQMS